MRCCPSQASSTHILFRSETQRFLCGLALRPHESGENGDQKCNFSKTLLKINESEIHNKASEVFS